MPQIHVMVQRFLAILPICSLLLMILTVPAWAGARQVLEELIRGTTRVADDLPLRRTDELLTKLSKSKAMQDMIEQELKTTGKIAVGAGETVPMVARSRNVLHLLRQATAQLDPSIMRRLEHLDEVTRESALVLARGGEHLSQTLPDLASRGRFLREAGSETVAAIGLHGPEAAQEAVRLHTALKAGTLLIPQGQAAITLADFGAAMTKSGQTSWKFWKAYVQPHWKIWLGSGALAVYLANPEYFQDASAQLTEAGFQHLVEFAGEVTAAAIRGTGQGAGHATNQVSQAVRETYFNGWQGLAAAIVTLLVFGAVLCTFRRVRFYVFRPLRWLQQHPKNPKAKYQA